MLIKNVTFGADPELFFRHPNGHYVSAIDKVGGTKEKPRPIEIAGAAVQEDNVAIEFNIAPVTNRKDFVRSIQDVLNYLDDFARKQKLTLALDAAAIFPDSELEDPRSWSFGCDPDFNAWLKCENYVPEREEQYLNLRSAGGHLHIGYENPQDDVSIELVKLLDIFIGCPSVLVDKDKLRRKMYGKAGAFRLKPYGVEYRTLSNYWLQSPAYMEFVINQANKAIDYYNDNGFIDFDRDWPLVNAIINESDVKHFEELKHYYPIY